MVHNVATHHQERKVRGGEKKQRHVARYTQARTDSALLTGSNMFCILQRTLLYLLTRLDTGMYYIWSALYTYVRGLGRRKEQKIGNPPELRVISVPNTGDSMDKREKLPDPDTNDRVQKRVKS